MLFAAVPAWVWATLLMIAFVAVSAGTMLLARYAIAQQPRGRAKDDSSKEER